MDKETLEKFNTELKALLVKYDVSLTLEDVPATKKIVVVSNKKVEDETGAKSKQKK